MTHLDILQLQCYDIIEKTSGLLDPQFQLFPLSTWPASDSYEEAVRYAMEILLTTEKIVLGVPLYNSLLCTSINRQKSSNSAVKRCKLGDHRPTLDFEETSRTQDDATVSTSLHSVVYQAARFVKDNHLAGVFYWAEPGPISTHRELMREGRKELCTT